MTENRKKKEMELLAPAGSYETFRAVINAGADAVYLGGNRFGARAYADNFKEEELLAAIDYAHIHERQVYLTINTLLKEKELEEELYEYLLPYYRQGLDAVIIQDLGAFDLISREFPDLPIHTSTQMTITNRYGAKAMKKMGASRIVTAREMSFAEIRDIHEHVDVEIESFVHGALCYCYSGQCLLSSMLGGRSGNRGRCAQPCRLPYEAYDADFHPITANGIRKLNGDYILSPKDLCTIEQIPELVESGIYSLKIEGRMKQAQYAAGVVSVYRRNLDRYLKLRRTVAENSGGNNRSEIYKETKRRYQVSKEDYRKLYDFGNRSGFTEGYYRKHNGSDMITFVSPNHEKNNGALQDEINQTYIQTELKEKINGNLRLNKDFPAIMELACKGRWVSVTGDVLQKASKQPLTFDKVEKNIKKTGNTPFEFRDLKIEMEEDLFLPVQSLNRIRRDALEELERELIKGYRREAPEMRLGEGNYRSSVKSEDPKKSKYLAVSIESRQMLEVILRYREIDAVYLDSSCYTRENINSCLWEDIYAVKKTGKEVYYVFPSVFRKCTAEFYEEKKALFLMPELDGIVIKSLDAAAFVRSVLGNSIRLLADHNLYTYNNRSSAMLNKFDIIKNTVPLELNRKELMGRNNKNSEMIIYGCLPLMTSVQCVHANLNGCDRRPVLTYLKDRYGKYFPVKNNCMECYNTLYNTTPLILFAFSKELVSRGIQSYRISFTKETEREIQQVMELYENTFLAGGSDIREFYAGDYTNGHYKRGVE